MNNATEQYADVFYLDQHLAYAAPDMLELLKRLEYWFDTDMPFSTEADARKNAEWLAEIRGVIATAKGEKI